MYNGAEQAYSMPPSRVFAAPSAAGGAGTSPSSRKVGLGLALLVMAFGIAADAIAIAARADIVNNLTPEEIKGFQALWGSRFDGFYPVRAADEGCRTRMRRGSLVTPAAFAH